MSWCLNIAFGCLKHAEWTFHDNSDVNRDFELTEMVCYSFLPSYRGMFEILPPTTCPGLSIQDCLKKQCESNGQCNGFRTTVDSAAQV